MSDGTVIIRSCFSVPFVLSPKTTLYTHSHTHVHEIMS